MFKRSLAVLGAVCLAAMLAAAPASAQRTKLTLYTALENDQLRWSRNWERSIPRKLQ